MLVEVCVHVEVCGCGGACACRGACVCACACMKFIALYILTKNIETKLLFRTL